MELLSSKLNLPCNYTAIDGRVDRTAFVRQAANLWRVKERLWQEVLHDLEFDEQVSLIDSFSGEVCRFARAA